MQQATRYVLFGSSANLSLAGTKFGVQDTEPEVRALGDLIGTQF